MQIKKNHTYPLRLLMLISCLLFLSANTLKADGVKEVLRIDYKMDGKVLSTKFAFEDSPKVTFEGETVYIQSDILSQTYIIDEVVCLKFDSDIPTSIEKQQSLPTSNSVAFTFYSSDLIKVTGDNLTPEVYLFTADGRQVSVQSDFSDKEININLGSLPRGLYIIKTNHHSFKFIRK